jgi:hypothetical protein
MIGDKVMRFYRWVMSQMRKAAIQPYHHNFYVRCSSCGEVLAAHVDMRNDLSIEYGEGDSPDRYFTRKTIIGSERCFAPIEIELHFDAKRNLTDQKIQGGEFIDQSEYQKISESSSLA